MGDPVEESNENNKNFENNKQMKKASVCVIRLSKSTIEYHIKNVNDKPITKIENDKKSEKHFNNTEILQKQNMSVHEKLKNHHCNLCSKTFSAAHLLKKHIKNVHEGIKKEGKHKCDLCEMSFTAPSKLKRHEGVFIILCNLLVFGHPLTSFWTLSCHRFQSKNK